MSKIFYRKVKASEEDKHLLRMLRISLSSIDTQYKLGTITEEEYIDTLKDIANKVLMLEGKYEL